MFKKILFATDISKASDAVLSCGNGLKNLGTEEIILFYALGVSHIESLKYLLKDISEPALLRQKKMLEDQGVNVKLEIARYFNQRNFRRSKKRLFANCYGESGKRIC